MKKAQIFFLITVFVINLITFPVFADELYADREVVYSDEFDGETEFGNQRGYTSVTVEDGYAQFVYDQGSSNYTYSGEFSVPAEECDMVAVRIKSDAELSSVNFYYMTDEDSSASTDKRIDFSVPSSEDWQIIELNTGNEAKWQGNITRYRFTFDKQSANTVKIDFVRFYGIDENYVEWPQSDELYPERRILRKNEFDSLSELDVWRDGYTSVAVKDGYAQFNYNEGTSNYTYSGTFSIPAEECDLVAIKIKSDVELSTVNFFYMTDKEPNASADKVINFSVPSSEDWQLITLDTAGIAKWQSNITRYRFSFGAPSDNTVKIDFVRFYSVVYPPYSENERQLSYDFLAESEDGGFIGNENVSDAVTYDGMLWARVSGEDSYFTSPVTGYELKSGDIPRIRIAYENQTDGTTGKLYFTTEENPEYTEECSFTLEISENSSVDCVIDTVDNPNWKGNITGLRFVPSDGEGYVKIDFLRFEKFPCEIVVRNGIVNISGNLYGMPEKTVYVSASSEETETVAYDGEAQTEADGKYSFEFSVPDAPVEPTIYNLEFSGDGIEGTYKKKIMYVSSDYVSGVLKQINEAKAEKDADALQKLIEDNYGMLSMQCEFYESFAADGLYLDELYALAADAEAAAELSDIEEQLDEAVVKVRINHMSQDEWLDAVDDYNEYLGFKSLSVYERYSESADSVKAEIAERMSSGSYEDFEAARYEFQEQNILVGLRYAIGWEDVRDIIDGNEDFIGISLDELDEVESVSGVYRRLTEKNFSGIEELKTAFEDAVTAQLEAEEEESSGSRGSSGGRATGGGSGGGAASVNAPAVSLNNPAQEETTAHTFADMDGYDWAKAAVEALYSEKIVNGLGNGCFGPSNSVTREEFVKMLVLKEKLALSNDCDFADVAEDMWYVPYIGAAVNAGITNGQGNVFGIGQLLTRQDAAVMLARALGLDGTVEAADFTDYGEIADYAREAVMLLTEAGIFTGYEDGSFRPDGSLSRAEAAVIIFRIDERK